jgi:hypothetical protein
LNLFPRFITVEVHLGAHFLYEYNENGRVIIVSRKKIIHEGYDLFNVRNDIGFVTLDEPVTLTPSKN